MAAPPTATGKNTKNQCASVGAPFQWSRRGPNPAAANDPRDPAAVATAL
ncbi:MAG TPA: hypothetical protein VGQ20_00850 [Acidimicrobiales bacterium]|nr:hypothetical protein [Acidimicrobiales bacterium]